MLGKPYNIGAEPSPGYQSMQLDLAFCLRQFVLTLVLFVAGRKYSTSGVVDLYGRSDTHGFFLPYCYRVLLACYE